jgi:hypothetical protein
MQTPIKENRSDAISIQRDWSGANIIAVIVPEIQIILNGTHIAIVEEWME